MLLRINFDSHIYKRLKYVAKILKNDKNILFPASVLSALNSTSTYKPGPA